MASQPHRAHRNRALTPRPSEEVRAAATLAAQRQGTKLSIVIVDFLAWYGGLTDQLPERPERVPDA